MSWRHCVRAFSSAARKRRSLLAPVAWHRRIKSTRLDPFPRPPSDTPIESFDGITTVAPQCKHFLQGCGGCKIQHIPYDQQLAHKQERINLLFANEGFNLKSVSVGQIVPSPTTKHYRNKMDFSFSARAWTTAKLTAPSVSSGGALSLGLMPEGSWLAAIDLEECLHPLEPVMRLVGLVRQSAIAAGLEAVDRKKQTGFLSGLGIRTAHDTHGNLQILMNLVTTSSHPELLRPLVHACLRQVPELTSVVNNVEPLLRTRHMIRTEHVLHGKSFISDTIHGLQFRISSKSFFQPNFRNVSQLYELVQQACKLTPQSVVWDLFCGTGTIALLMARQCKQVIGLEIEESAVLDAIHNGQLNQLCNAQFHQVDLAKLKAREVEDMLTSLPRPDVVVVDPPRAGLHPSLPPYLLALAPTRIVYVSCNPATQAVDVRKLCESQMYTIERMQPVDMFPHTTHVENICSLKRISA
eukprot:GILK01005702.1.p1 GENE.GILK01005702.1~~GILK01005702.1.p1  ORF type:complete len:467 (-),score=58.69 GILK01005702.1:3-1403(-)